MTLLPPQSPPSSSFPAQQPQAIQGPSSSAIPAAMAGGGASGFDIWGPIQRRKYLIALFVLLGALGGYLYYINCPKTYSSSTRLMITTNTPPSMLDGDRRQAKESLEKHASLVASELILEDAINEGNLEQLEVFENTSYPLGQLTEMLSVIPETKETMILVCSGSTPHELPRILNAITDSYEKTIKEDSLAIGQKMVSLIQRLADKLSDKKEIASEQRDQLWQSLNIQEFDKDGLAINPHNRQLSILQTQRDEMKLKLSEILDRQNLLAKNLELDKETEDVDPERISIAALEARDYLRLTPKPYQEEALGGSQVARNLTPELQRRQSLTNQVWDLELKIDQQRFLRADLSSRFGKGYDKIISIDKQIARFETRRKELARELAEINKYIENQMRDAEAKPEEKVERMTLEMFRANEEREWVGKYRLRLKQEQAQQEANIKAIERQIDDVSRKARAASAQIVKLNRLSNEIKQKDEAVTAITEKLAEIDVVNNNYTMTNIKILDRPKQGVLVAPSLPKSLALGAMIAFVLGLGLAILVDQSELAYRNPAEIFDRIQVPVVGRIPRINTRQIEPALGHPSLIAAHKPAATASESFRDVRTALFFRANMDDVKTILFTSPSPGDGKSTTICNLAISIAQAGKKVILMDADFRRPRIHQYFGQELNPGLMDVLNGELPLKDAIQTAELQENLFLLPSGGRPQNPGELVTSEAFSNLIDALREKFDYVLIDSPPVLPVSDPATISSLVDGVYLVTRIRKGVKLTTQKAKETLDRVGANWMGVIVNGLDENPHYSEYGYQYGSYSYYGGIYGRYYDSANRTYRDKITS